MMAYKCVAAMSRAVLARVRMSTLGIQIYCQMAPGDHLCQQDKFPLGSRPGTPLQVFLPWAVVTAFIDSPPCFYVQWIYALYLREKITDSDDDDDDDQQRCIILTEDVILAVNIYLFFSISLLTKKDPFFEISA